MKKLLVGSALALAAVVGAPTAEAQSKPEFGGFVGVGLPVGDFGDGVDAGWRIGGLVQVKPASLPFSIRGEVGYQSFGIKSPGSGNVNILDVTANGVFPFGDQKATTSFYGIGGAGIYSINRGVGTEFGLNGGLGLNFNLGGFKAFSEARLHHIFTSGSSSQVIPLTFGIRF